MTCENCPYNEEFDFKEENIWCDKVGGRVYQFGCCSECEVSKDVVAPIVKKSRRNKRERYLFHQKHLKYLYEIVGGYYPTPVTFEDEYISYGYCSLKRKKPYYKRLYRTRSSRYYKKSSNRAIRRYKGEIYKGGQYHKIYDFWWKYC